MWSPSPDVKNISNMNQPDRTKEVLARRREPPVQSTKAKWNCGIAGGTATRRGQEPETEAGHLAGEVSREWEEGVSLLVPSLPQRHWAPREELRRTSQSESLISVFHYISDIRNGLKRARIHLIGSRLLCQNQQTKAKDKRRDSDLSPP